MRGTTNVPCVYVLLRRDGDIAFVMREHTGYMDGKYSLPAGHLEGLESFHEAAVREAKEEANATVKPEDLRHVHTLHRNQGDHVRIDVFFEASRYSGEIRNNEPESHSALVWLPEANVPYDTIMDFQAQALRHIAKGESYSQFGWQR